MRSPRVVCRELGHDAAVKIGHAQRERLAALAVAGTARGIIDLEIGQAPGLTAKLGQPFHQVCLGRGQIPYRRTRLPDRAQ